MSYPSILQQPQGLACLGFISSTIPLRPPGLRKGLERLKGRSSSMDDSRILVGRSWGNFQVYTDTHAARASILGGAKDRMSTTAKGEGGAAAQCRQLPLTTPPRPGT